MTNDPNVVKLREAQKYIRELGKQVQALKDCLKYYIGPIDLDEDIECDGPRCHPKKVWVVRATLNDEESKVARALGVLRRFIPTERGQDLLAELERLEIDPTGLAQAAEAFAGLLRNGSERLAIGAIRLCVQCRLPLVGQRKDARFCSDKCRMANQKRSQGNRVVRVRTTGPEVDPT